MSALRPAVILGPCRPARETRGLQLAAQPVQCSTVGSASKHPFGSFRNRPPAETSAMSASVMCISLMHVVFWGMIVRRRQQALQGSRCIDSAAALRGSDTEASKSSTVPRSGSCAYLKSGSVVLLAGWMFWQAMPDSPGQACSRFGLAFCPCED